VYSKYKNTALLIKNIAQQQSVTDSKDKTLTKKERSTALIIKTMQLVTILQAHFLFINDITHTNAINIAISGLQKLADNNLVDKCQEIHDIANGVIADLADYNIDAAWLTAYQNQLNDFDSITAAPRVATVNRASLTAQLGTLFNTAKAELDHVSTLVKLLEYTDPVFYASYKNAIKIINVKSNPIDFRLTVKDTNGAAQRGFTLTLLRLSNNEALQFKTNPNGIIQRKSLAEGNYDITLTKIDYAPLVGRISVVAGETYNLDVTIDTTNKTIIQGKNPKTGEMIP
jgi:Carboxypeptidase regulatory-like domain